MSCEMRLNGESECCKPQPFLIIDPSMLRLLLENGSMADFSKPHWRFNCHKCTCHVICHRPALILKIWWMSYLLKHKVASFVEVIVTSIAFSYSPVRFGWEYLGLFLTSWKVKPAAHSPLIVTETHVTSQHEDYMGHVWVAAKFCNIFKTQPQH